MLLLILPAALTGDENFPPFRFVQILRFRAFILAIRTIVQKTCRIYCTVLYEVKRRKKLTNNSNPYKVKPGQVVELLV